jgi:hypothetical protein
MMCRLLLCRFARPTPKDAPSQRLYNSWAALARMLPAPRSAASNTTVDGDDEAISAVAPPARGGLLERGSDMLPLLCPVTKIATRLHQKACRRR